MTHVAILAMARQSHGGTLLYTRSMVEALRELPVTAFRFTLFTTADNHEYDDLGIPVVRLPATAVLIGNRLLGRDPFEQADVVLSPIYSTILLTTRRPFAFTLHDLQEKYYPQYFTRATRLWRHVTNRLLTGAASQVVCESTFVRDDIIKYFGVSSDRIQVIPAPPVALMRMEDVDAAQIQSMRNRFGLSTRYVLYASQFWPHKNHRRLVQAFAQVASEVKDCTLVLTGKQRDEYPNVMALVRELGLESRVRHIGYVEAVDLAALYRGAALVAVPTLFESISIPVYEAFSMGTPVCASAVVALPEQIGDAGLLFDPLSVNDIATSVLRLLRDPELCAVLVERGKQRMQSMTKQRYSARLADLIGQLESVLSAARS